MSASTSSTTSVLDQTSASDPSRCSSPSPSTTTTVVDSHNNKRTKVTSTADTSTSRSKSKGHGSSDSRQDTYPLPAPGHTFLDHCLHRIVPSCKWEPSREELNVAYTGARNAQAVLRRLQSSQTLWTSKLIAEICDKHQMHDQQDGFNPIIPSPNNAVDRRITEYRNAIQGCEKEIRGVKRALNGYACVFDRHHEFGNSEYTTHVIERRYIFHGDHLGQHPRRPRRVSPQLSNASQLDAASQEAGEQSDHGTQEPQASDKENEEPQYSSGSSTGSSLSGDDLLPLPGKNAVPKEERCTLCIHVSVPMTPHRAAHCPFNRRTPSP